MPRPLWAPWRMEYIRSAHAQSGTGRETCLFCRLLKSKDDQRNLILHRGRLGFVVMNRFPYNNGHLMVAPNRHVASYVRLTPREGAEIHRLLQLSLRALRQVLKPDGFNTGMNLGRVAGAGVTGHVHLHVVPRWLGDVNYMPLLAETKVISEHLEATYGRLRPVFRHRNQK